LGRERCGAYPDSSELSEGLLNDALKSIIQQEAKENEDSRKILGRLQSIERNSRA